MDTRKEKNQINLNPIRRLFDGDRLIPQRHLDPYVTKGQVVADLGCGPGYYTLALAECIGAEGKVYAVDSDPHNRHEIEEFIKAWLRRKRRKAKEAIPGVV